MRNLPLVQNLASYTINRIGCIFITIHLTTIQGSILGMDDQAFHRKQYIKYYFVWALIVTSLHYSGLVWRGIMIAVIGASTAFAIFWAVRHYRPAARAPWLYLMGAIILFAAGDATYSLLIDVFHQVNPFPSLADVFYILTYPFFAAAFISFLRYWARHEKLGDFIDAMIVTTAMALLVWIFLISPNVMAHVPLPVKIVSAAYPIEDVMIWSLLIQLLLVGYRNKSIQFLALGGLGLITSDVLYGLSQLNGGWEFGTPVDVGWILFYFSAGAAALHPSMRGLTSKQLHVLTRTNLGRIPMMIIASLIAPATLFLENMIYGSPIHSNIIAICSAVLFLLVIARLVLTNREINRKDRDSYFRALIQHASDVILIADLYGRIKYASPSLQKLMSGTTPESDLLEDWVHDDDKNAVRKLFNALREGDAEISIEEWRMKSGDKTVEIEATGANLKDDPAIKGIVITLHEVTKQRNLERDLKFKAFHDSLTGLANRVLFHERLEHALLRGHRDDKIVSVLFIDLDDFKIINDTLGHAVGDALLVEVGRRISGSIRSVDTAARLGGDEFAVLIEDAHQNVEAHILADKLCAQFREPFNVEGEILRISASIGCALSTFGQSADEMLRYADLALYEAKSDGKGHWRPFRFELQTTMLERHRIREDLAQAINNREFNLHFQSIVDIETAEIKGYESLLRWRHPERGLLMPENFISVAEETGQIIALGNWVLEAAIIQGAKLHAMLGQKAPYISANVSVRQFIEEKFVTNLKHLLHKHRLPGDHLVLEITENVLMLNDETTRRTIRHLQKVMKVRIAIDDFGTGYSSLSYLSMFSPDILKIDQSFVSGLTRSRQQFALVEAIVWLAKALGLVVIAEGIESTQQCTLLQETGCMLGQGYLFSVPAMEV